ncbi:MAG: hypothetical protein R2797_01975 [Gelidibacter sp.]
MIDFVRIHYGDKSEFEPYVDNPSNFKNLYKVLESHSGEVLYPYRTKLKIMDIVVLEKGGYVKNSLHKLYNYIHFKEDQNHNDFTHTKLIESIQYVSKVPNLTRTRLTQLEFGLNIRVDKPAEDIIKQNILMHQYENYTNNKRFDGKGELKEFFHANYLLKVYDKAKQYKLPYNVLRFEVKFTRRRDFNDAGIYNLEDLKDKENLKSLFDIYMRRFDELQIIDNLDNRNIDSADFNKLILYTNPKYWQEDLKLFSGQTRMRKRREFNSLIQKYGLDSTKKQLRGLLAEKFNYLLNN